MTTNIQQLDFFEFNEAVKQRKTLVFVASLAAAIAVEKFCAMTKASCLSTRWLNSEALLTAFNTEKTEHGLVAISVLPQLSYGCRVNADMIVWGTSVPVQKTEPNSHALFMQAISRGLRSDTRIAHMPVGA